MSILISYHLGNKEIPSILTLDKDLSNVTLFEFVRASCYLGSENITEKEYLAFVTLPTEGETKPVRYFIKDWRKFKLDYNPIRASNGEYDTKFINLWFERKEESDGEPETELQKDWNSGKLGLKPLEG